MARNKRSGNKPPAWANRADTPGVKVDPGPYIGIIKNNVDPARLGRLQVWIPELGGEEYEPSTWYPVSYASPYFGSVAGIPGSPEAGQFGTEQQTYGFWATPPDVNNKVLVTFVMGDPGKGYWFACVQNTPAIHMVPGIARPIDSTQIIIDATMENRADPAESYLPVSELNTDNADEDTAADFLTSPRIIHQFQANIVLEQGLDTDPDRGTITSSAQRDTPSRVFGISTPGRTTPDETDLTNFEELVNSGKLSIEGWDQYFVARKGGHTFVMDDGDVYGDNNLVRLRTAGGHTLLMNDTADMVYVINKNGTAWVELTGEGSINVYGKNTINVRAGHELNLHADANINIHAGDTISMFAGSMIRSETKVQLTTSDTLYNLNAGVIGIRSGGNMDFRAVNSTFETEGDIVIKSNASTSISTTDKMILKSGKFYATSGAEMILTSVSTGSGWNNTGELWFKGSQVYLNTSGKVPAAPPAPPPTNPPPNNPAFELYKQADALYEGDLKRWIATPNQFESVAPFTPGHEPWTRQTGLKKFANGTTQTPTQQGDYPSDS